MIRKKNALLTAERKNACLHEHGQFIGSVPNTGPFVCRMCGVPLVCKLWAEFGKRGARLDREVWKEI